MKTKKFLSTVILLLLIFFLLPSLQPERRTNTSSNISHSLQKGTEVFLPTSVFSPKAERFETVLQKDKNRQADVSPPPQDETSENTAAGNAVNEEETVLQKDKNRQADGSPPPQDETSENTAADNAVNEEETVPDIPSENPTEKESEPSVEDTPGKILPENKEKTSEIPEGKEDADVQNIPKETPREESQRAPEAHVSMVPLGTLGKTSEKAPPRYQRFLTTVRAVEKGMRNSVYTDDCAIFSTGTSEYIFFDFPLEDLSDALSYLFPYTGEQQRDKSGIAYGRNFFLVLDGELEELTAQETKVRDYVQKAASVVSPEMTEREAYRAIHDYVCGYLDYDYTYTSRSLLDGFDSHTGVCETYARMTKAICEQVGIECEYHAEKISKGNHAWNRVKLDGNWYFTDTCWDGAGKETTYQYYLSDTVWEDHKS